LRYAVLARERYEDGAYAVTTLREGDMPAIGRWRNAQIEVLRQERLLTDDDQRAYYAQAVRPAIGSRTPAVILFSYLLEGVCIGYGGLTNVSWPSRRAELSFLLDPARLEADEGYRRDFSTFLGLMKRIAFGELGLHRLFTETFDLRPLHVRVLEENGFVLEGRLRGHQWIGGRPVDSLVHGCLEKEQ
jgi:RimJ/RimL family protein N-acetyltransferase